MVRYNISGRQTSYLTGGLNKTGPFAFCKDLQITAFEINQGFQAFARLKGEMK